MEDQERIPYTFLYEEVGVGGGRRRGIFLYKRNDTQIVNVRYQMMGGLPATLHSVAGKTSQLKHAMSGESLV